MRILDATAGMRGIWYQKNNPRVVFADMRKGKFIQKMAKNDRVVPVFPDVVYTWHHVPFRDNTFDMVIFDPPHLITEPNTKLMNMTVKYGFFYKDNWKAEIRIGAAELFRVLKPEGTFILKWAETNKSIEDVLNLIPYAPMFGTRTGQKNKTHWILFIKQKTKNKR